MPQRLSDISPDEVSLVHRGANRRQFLFAKGDENVVEVAPELATALETAGEGEDAIFKALQDAGVDVEQGAAAIAAFRLLKANADELPAPFAAALAAIEGNEFTPEPAPPAPDPVLKNEEESVPVDGVPFKKSDGSWDLSSVPEEQRPALEVVLKAADAENAALRSEISNRDERIEKAEQIAQTERDLREQREFLAKAEQLDKLPLAPDEFGPLLKTIAGAVDETTYGKLEGVLKAANEAVEQGALFSELGRDGIASTDAEQQIEKAADKLREGDPTLTKQQAIAKALDADPELYAAYRREEA